MIRQTLLLLLAGGIIVISFLTGTYFYRKNLLEMRAIGETCFINTLTAELEKKQKQLNIPFFSSGVCTDTLSSSIRIITNEGIKTFEVDSAKSRRNLSQALRMRSMHSFICEESPLSADSLNRSWFQSLLTQGVNVETSIRLSIMDLYENVSHSRNKGKSYAASASCLSFVTYVGDRCEIEVRGSMPYSFWQVVFYHGYPFLWILLGVIILFSILYYIYWLMRRPPKVKLVTKEVTHEVIKFVKDVDLNEPECYRLFPNLVFDVKHQMLLEGDKKIKLPPQSCLILKLFLDAPCHTLTDEEIIKGIWPKAPGMDIHRFSMAYSRLCRLLAKHGFIIKFIRVESQHYRLILPEYNENVCANDAVT